MSTASFVHGDDPDTEGRTVPPYEGRRETADVEDQSESVKDDARTAGATGLVTDDQMKAPEPGETAHIPGTPRGEDLSKE